MTRVDGNNSSRELTVQEFMRPYVSRSIDMARRETRGFTLIELLVVISVIAVLLAILMPALGKARTLAKRIYCGNNIKNQALYQKMYASDNSGKFHPHDDHSPEYVRSSGNHDSLYDAMIDYIEDFGAMVCPVQRTMKHVQGYLADVEWYVPTGYGGWDSVKPEEGQDPANILSGYMWLANYTYFGQEPEYSFSTSQGKVNNTVRWPKHDGQATSRTPMIAHRISNATGAHFWDLSHGGNDLEMSTEFEVFSTSTDNPLGYGDGSVKYNMRSAMKARARIPPGIYYY